MTQPASGEAVVFVLDGSSALAAISSGLADVGFSPRPVRGAAHGLSLLRRTGADQPQLAIVVDDLPGVTAEMLVEAVRNLPGRETLPVIRFGSPRQDPVAGVICLPVPAERSAVAQAVRGLCAIPERQPAGGVVLVVDDDQVNRMVLQRLVEALGLACECCGDGYAGVERVARGGIGLVLMDVMMPDFDGCSATREIRRREAANPVRLPIVAVTANTQAECHASCIAAGMDEVLAKPVSQHDMERICLRWLTGFPAGNGPERVGQPVDNILDPSILRHIDSLQPGSAQSILKTFGRDLDRCLEEMPMLLEQRGHAKLSQIAHRLRGSAGTLGAEHLSAICGRIEQAARNGDHERCVAAVAEMAPARDAFAQRVGSLWPLSGDDVISRR